MKIVILIIISVSLLFTCVIATGLIVVSYLTTNGVGITSAGPMAPVDSIEEITTYRDEEVGFEFDFPAGWYLVEMQGLGADSRGNVTSIASWPTAPDSAVTPEGETRFDVTVLRWEPLDLTQYVATRKEAWVASGLSIVSEEAWILANDLEASRFLVATPDEGAVFFLFTLIGERFVSLSGNGDLEQLEQIARTLRSIEAPGQPG